MEIRLLGQVGLWHAGREIALARPHRRCVLAALAMTPGQPVSVQTLVARVWDERPPREALHSLYTHVSAVKRRLEAAGGGDEHTLVRRVQGGYLLEIDPYRVDLHRARHRADEARALVASEPATDRRVVELLREACSLWRGTPLGGLKGDWAARVRTGLEQEALTLTLERFDAELRLGDHASAVGPLATLLADHPLVEPLVGLQMLALYRCGQQADALELYARTRRRLVDDLGDEPGVQLRQLHERVLRRDPSLDFAGAGDPPVAVPPAASADQPPPSGAPPAQLPATVAGFTGREAELKALDEILAHGAGSPAAPVVIAAVSGCGGVGKTALVVKWAHRVAERFPDGQLFVNLRGFDHAAPLRPIDALATLLRSLGTPADQVPVEVSEAAALYRSRLAAHRVLLVLDNAGSAEQVRPLLPGSPGCLVILTSRNRLPGLVARDGACRIDLDVLPPDDAVALLGRLLGPQRLQAEPAAARELARLCARLPLALRIAAATLADHPDRGIADHVATLRDGDLLSALDVGDDPAAAVLATYDLSYGGISAAAGRLFRLLGLVPGRDFCAAAAAALVGAPPKQAEELLDRLVGVHLVDRPAPGRYTFHDLLRLYARERTIRHDGQADRDQAVQRLLAWYLNNAAAAAGVLYPEVLRATVPAPDPHVPPAGFDGPAAAMAWLEAERPNLVAAIRHTADHGPRTLAWRLSDQLRGYLWLRRHVVDWLAIADVALRAAATEGDPLGQATARLSLGDLHLAMSRYPHAAEHYSAALEFARQAQWHAGQASARANLGTVAWERGQLVVAADHLTQSLALYERLSRLAPTAAVLAKLGVIHRELGRLRAAADHLSRAVAILRQTDSRGNEAHALGNLGQVHHDLGRVSTARNHLERALTLYGEVGDRYGEANVLRALAAVDHDAGHDARALERAETSVVLAERLDDHRTKADALTTLGSIELHAGRPESALAHHRDALLLANQSGARIQQGYALLGMAEAASRLGRHAEAVGYAQQALAIAIPAGYRLLEGHAWTGLAAAHLARGDHDTASGCAKHALVIHRETEDHFGHARTVTVLEQLRQAVASNIQPAEPMVFLGHIERDLGGPGPQTRNRGPVNQ